MIRKEENIKGITLTLCALNTDSLYAYLIINNGSIFEIKHEEGYTHLLEHMFLLFVSYQGLYASGETDYDNMILKFVSPNHYSTTIDMLTCISRIVNRDILNEELFKQAKNNVLTEILENDTKIEYQLFKIRALTNNKVKTIPTGNWTNIANCQYNDIKDYYDRYITSNNVKILICGDINFSLINEKSKIIFNQTKTLMKHDMEILHASESITDSSIQDYPYVGGVSTIAFRISCIISNSNDYFVQLIGNNYLFNKFSIRIDCTCNTKVIDKNLKYLIFAFNKKYRINTDQLITNIIASLNNCFFFETINQIKNALYNQLIGIQNNIHMYTLFNYEKRYFLYNEPLLIYQSPAWIYNKLNTISIDKIKDYILLLLRGDCICF